MSLDAETGEAIRSKNGRSLGWAALLVPVYTLVLLCFLIFAIGASYFALLLSWKYSAKSAFSILRHANHLFYYDQTMVIVAYLIFFFMLWQLYYKRPPADAVSFSPISRRDGLMAAMGAILVAGGLVVATISTTHLHHAYAPTVLGSILVAATYVFISPPLEEMYFRGLLLNWLSRRTTRLQASLLSTALFTAIHFRFSRNPTLEASFVTIADVLLGYIACQWTFRSRSLWPATIQHMVYNAIMLATL